MLIIRSTKLRFLAWIVGGLLSLSAVGGVKAADCGCEIACDSFPAAASGCDCGCDHAHGGLLTKGLHRFHESLKKLRDMKWCKLGGHGDALCDDACDAAMMDDLMHPSTEIIYQGHSHPHNPHHEHPSASPAVETMAPPVHVQEKKIESDLFDSLPDPFTDDEAKMQTRRSIRPSSHDEVVLQPAPDRPLSTSQSSRRRFSNVR